MYKLFYGTCEKTLYIPIKYYDKLALKNYAYLKNMCYSDANLRKKVTFKKLHDYISTYA
ncbi:hypothetical protein CLSA_c25020 [Clostridium saccharobutylicum DSM 13864]|uniref:Uncharacterized protein n=1 Tax=Clostridium saccharobutylicum DSM 13864 TaxID=1345695 RepID=U5MSA3_CLOSA|nr:hypothetical protein CLSA_c25020 [Clostridium saccharobutylicum DSM 13864]